MSVDGVMRQKRALLDTFTVDIQNIAIDSAIYSKSTDTAKN